MSVSADTEPAVATDVVDTGIGGGEPADPGEPTKSRFTLPSAYTILFGLIVVVAIATWIIPAVRYALDPEGSQIPGSYQQVDPIPKRIVVDSLEALINGLYAIQ